MNIVKDRISNSEYKSNQLIGYLRKLAVYDSFEFDKMPISSILVNQVFLLDNIS